MSRDDESLEESSAPLIEHLAELRTCLIRAALAFVVGLFACFGNCAARLIGEYFEVSP